MKRLAPLLLFLLLFLLLWAFLATALLSRMHQ